MKRPPQQQKAAPDRISVCICTYRRPHVIATIESVAAQALADALTITIIVVDNDAAPSAQELVRAYCETRPPLDLKYIHAPASNISVARNAGMDAATTRWLAFIDDDEIASTDWLANLYAKRQGADAVFGPCEAIYRSGTPGWIKSGEYHSNRIAEPRTPIDTGYSSNVLIDLSFARLHRLRFDNSLGRTGGEDTMFFHAMYRKGGRLIYAADAVVYDDVAPSRLNIAWILRRRYRGGQVYAMMYRRFDLMTYRRVAWTAPLKIGTCFAMVGATVFKPRHAMWWLVRGAFHSGVLSYALGMDVIDDRDSGAVHTPMLPSPRLLGQRSANRTDVDPYQT